MYIRVPQIQILSILTNCLLLGVKRHPTVKQGQGFLKLGPDLPCSNKILQIEQWGNALMYLSSSHSFFKKLETSKRQGKIKQTLTVLRIHSHESYNISSANSFKSSHSPAVHKHYITFKVRFWIQRWLQIKVKEKLTFMVTLPCNVTGAVPLMRDVYETIHCVEKQ